MIKSFPTGEMNKLVFNLIPSDFKYHKKVYVIQYEFSGIQSFIFGDVTLLSTKEEIAARSEYIKLTTDRMEEWIRTRLSGRDRFRVLSKSSGKLIYAVSYWIKESKIISMSEELQKIIYASTKGRLEMFYALSKAKVVRCNENNPYSNVMSILSVRVNKNKFHCVNTLGANIEDNIKEEFIPEINTSRRTLPEDSKCIRVAVKFDLDNLGAFFKRIETFDERKAASESLENVLKSAFDNISGVTPLYIGGDDIFAIAELDTYLQTVNQMHKNIVEGIFLHDELFEYRQFFGISGGISFIRNDLGKVPLVYYFEQSEDKLMKAKSVIGKNVISVSNSILTWEQLDIFSSVVDRKKEKIFQKLSEQQIINMYFNIRELKTRILRINKNTKGKLLTREEEDCVYNIN